MPLPKPPSRTPVSIGVLTITLQDIPVSAEVPVALQQILYRVEVLNAAGKIIDYDTDIGSLEQYLTAGQISTLKNFMTTIRAKAVAEILG